jgi:hypothetical protein
VMICTRIKGMLACEQWKYPIGNALLSKLRNLFFGIAVADSVLMLVLVQLSTASGRISSEERMSDGCHCAGHRHCEILGRIQCQYCDFSF